MNKNIFFWGRSDYSYLTIAFSAAATWTWAPALILSTDIAANKGLIGSLSFILPNVLALIIFAYIGRRIQPAYIFESKILQTIYNIGYASIDLFCVLMQATAGANLCQMIFGINYVWCALILICICFSYSIIGGLHYSIVTDSWQQISLIIGSLIIFIYFLKNINNIQVINIGSFSLKDFLIYTLILFSGPIMTNQHWQRANKRGYLWSSLFFALPLIFLSAIGLFSSESGNYVALKIFPSWVLFLFFMLVLAGLMSSMDSAFSSISTLFFNKETTESSLFFGRFKMVIIAILASIPVIFNFSIMNIWLTMGSYRVLFALILIWRLFCYQQTKRFFINFIIKKSKQK